MKIENIDIISPELFPQETFNETEAFGALIWLWAASPVYQHAGVQEAAINILPVLKNGQFALFSNNGHPIGYCTWAYFNEETERQYLQSNDVLQHAENWRSGNKMWFINWFAPFGDSRIMKRILVHLFPEREIGWLYHRGSEKGKRIMKFQGLPKR
ncbi:toxin-activating lysine-acyltransferase [Neisseria leonii]|uniref:RTX toxin-activating lysine-acyltransferase n=1 Tax=Neisseria leonii TaxID=2995413 RepID=A0A9X4E6L6_9NEIS|nr:toxin-activating lysine-acyltransferase [Neisseria sp. 51.81]MDD9328771.1 toxin-activating lysine-acyltransferase [Neisseria sp. 51.81]